VSRKTSYKQKVAILRRALEILQPTIAVSEGRQMTFIWSGNRRRFSDDEVRALRKIGAITETYRGSNLQVSLRKLDSLIPEASNIIGGRDISKDLLSAMMEFVIQVATTTNRVKRFLLTREKEIPPNVKSTIRRFLKKLQEADDEGIKLTRLLK
jgi:hypothetical protein